MDAPTGGRSWKSPQGQIKTITTILWIVGLAGAGFLVLDKVLPLIIRVLQMGIHAALLAIPAAVLLIILSSPRFWFFLNYIMKTLGNFIVGFWQDVDPIGVLKACLADMKERVKRIFRARMTVQGVIRDLKETIEANTARHQETVKLAGAARKQGNPYQFTLQARRAGRLEKSNMTYAKLLEKLEVVQRVLTRMGQAAEFVVEDKTDEVFELERRKKAVNAAHRAMKDAWAIIKGGRARELFDSTAERLVGNLNQQLGEIDGFMEIAEGFIGSVDLVNGVYEEEMLQKLLEWEKHVDSVILGDEKAQLIANAGIAVETELGEGRQRQSGKYTKYLGSGSEE